MTFNRTRIECKLESKQLIKNAIIAFNRTRIECKYVYIVNRYSYTDIL